MSAARAKKPQLTPEEKSTRKAREAVQLRITADTATVKECMKEHPDCARDLRKTLSDLGYLDHKGKVKKAEPSTFQMPDKSGGAGRGSAGCRGNPTVDEVCAGEVFKSPNDASPEFLAVLLEQCEPVTFAPYALRGVLLPTQRKVPKNVLLDCVVFVTGWEKDEPWDGYTCNQDILKEARALSQQLGRRGRDLQMKVGGPCWQGQGVFQPLVSENKLILKNRFTNRAAEVKHPAFTALPISADLFSVSKNMSERGARLMRLGVPKGVPCVDILPAELTPWPATAADDSPRGVKRSQAQMCDGPIAPSDQVPARIGEQATALSAGEDGLAAVAPQVLLGDGGGEGVFPSSETSALGENADVAPAQPCSGSSGSAASELKYHTKQAKAKQAHASGEALLAELDFKLDGL